MSSPHTTTTNVATDYEMLQCKGKNCGGKMFKSNEVGANKVLMLCALCHNSLKSFIEEGDISGQTSENISDSSGIPSRFFGNEDEEGTKTPLSNEMNDEEVDIDEQHTNQQQEADSSSVLPVVLPVDTPAPPSNIGQMKAMFRVLVSMARNETMTMTLNSALLQWELADAAISIMKNTHHFFVVGRERLKLYWFEQYGAIMTPSHLYVEYCSLSNGDVIVGVWETRCNRPFHAILVWRRPTGKCELFTVADHRHVFLGVVLDPSATFDFEICYKAKMEWLVVHRRIFDIKRGLHENCKHPEVSDPHDSDGDDDASSDGHGGIGEDYNLSDEGEDEVIEDSVATTSASDSLKSLRKSRRKRKPVTQIYSPAIEKRPKRREAQKKVVKERKKPTTGSQPRRSPRKHVIKESHNDAPLRKRPPLPPPSKRLAPPSGDDDIKAVLTKMVQQQSELLKLMHDNCNATEPGLREEKTSTPSSKQLSDPTLQRKHSMQSFIENNLEMARLIEENARLRKERLVQKFLSSYMRNDDGNF